MIETPDCDQQIIKGVCARSFSFLDISEAARLVAYSVQCGRSPQAKPCKKNCCCQELLSAGVWAQRKTLASQVADLGKAGWKFLEAANERKFRLRASAALEL